MEFQVRDKNGIVIITMTGDMVGGPAANELREKLHELVDQGRKYIVVDMQQIHFMNSSGLGILIGGLNTVRQNGGDLKLLNLAPKPRQVLKITQLDRVFSIFNNEDEAVDSFTK